MMSYDNAKACAVVEAPTSITGHNSNNNNNLNNNNNNNLDLDDDQPENLVSDTSPKGNSYNVNNNHYGEKGTSVESQNKTYCQEL